MTWKENDLVITRHYREWYIDPDTGELIKHSPFETRERKEAGYDSEEPYPGPFPLFAKPSGGGNSKRITEDYWKLTRGMNPPLIWRNPALRADGTLEPSLCKLNYCWANWRPNKDDYPGQEQVLLDDPPYVWPFVEAITSLYNVHRVVDRRNGSTRIAAYRFGDPAPDVVDEYMTCTLRSIALDGTVADMGSKIPLIVIDEAWIPDEQLEFYDVQLPKEPNVTTLDFIDVSHHNGAPYKNNSLDWQAIRDAGIDGGIAKIWDGWYLAPGGYAARQHFDDAFLDNWNGMVELALRGGYLFGRFDTAAHRPDSLAEQTAAAIDYIPSPRKAEDIFMMDAEQPANQIAHIGLASREEMLVEALQEAETKWPKKYIWLYSAKWWWNYQMPVKLNPYFLEFPMVVAYYGTKKLTEYLPNGWPIENVIAHQFTDQYNIPGYPNSTLDFDGNDFLWDWDEYFDTANPTPPPPLPPPDDNPEKTALLADMQAVLDKHK